MTEKNTPREYTDKQKLQEMERIAGSNEFWALGSGEHLNMIDTLIVFVHSAQEEIARIKELAKDWYRSDNREMHLIGVKILRDPDRYPPHGPDRRRFS